MTEQRGTPGERDKRESEQSREQGGGMPGDGVGRREDPGRTGVHPASAGWPETDMPIRREAEWGQGERGAAGYEDSGSSEISPPEGTSQAEGDVTEPPSGQG